MRKIYSLLVLALFTNALLAQVEVTFSVDMNEQTVASAGVFVTGSWMDDAGLGSEWQEPGSNASAQLTDPDGDGVYTLTVTMAAGEYQYKYSNGGNWPNAEAGGGGDNYQADLSGCDGTDNGFGGYNRNMTVPAGDSFAPTTYLFNSCTESTLASTNNLSSVTGITLQPNPASTQVEIMLTGSLNSDHTLTIFSFTGQMIERINLGQENQFTVNVADFPAGMYLLSFQNDRGETGSKKLMIK